MIRAEYVWLAATFCAGACLTAIAGWPADPSAALAIGPVPALALAGVSGLAMMLVVGQVAPPGRAGLVMSLCLPLVTLVRAAGEPGLAGLLALAVLAGAAAVLPGVAAGALVLRMQARPRG